MAKPVPKVSGDVFGCSKTSDKLTEIEEQMSVWLGPKSQRKPKSILQEAAMRFSPTPEHIQLFFSLQAQEEFCLQFLPCTLWDKVTTPVGIPYSPATAACQHLCSTLSTLFSQPPTQIRLLLLALSILSEGVGITGHVTTEQAGLSVLGELLKLIGTN